MKSQKFNIIEVDKGIANRLPNYTIEINRKLNQEEYIQLLHEIKIHEMKHSEGFAFKDILLDLKGFKHKKLYWKFVFSNTSSWWQFLPFYKASDKKIYWDLTLLLAWGISLFLIGILGEEILYLL